MLLDTHEALYLVKVFIASLRSLLGAPFLQYFESGFFWKNSLAIVKIDCSPILVLDFLPP